MPIESPLFPPHARTFVNDVHSKLNRTPVACVAHPRSAEEVARLVHAGVAAGAPVTACGGRHAMGGQAFAREGLLLDLSELTGVLGHDVDARTITVEAGIRWPELIAAVRALEAAGAPPLAIVQKQTGADRMTLGGSLSANVHGRGLGRPPIAAEVVELVLVDARGELRRCSATREPELFSLALGGYGLFGVIVEATLRLEPRARLRRRVVVRESDGLMEAFAERRRAGARYGDFQFAIDPESPDFLRRGVFSCYEPAAADAVEASGHRVLSADAWRGLLHLAHVDKGAAFERYAEHYLATDGQLYDSDTHQLAPYLDDYHEAIDQRLGGPAGSEVITELYAPRQRFDAFLAGLRRSLRATGADPIYGTVRLIERDGVTFLPWAREPWACVVLNLHVDHTPDGLRRAAHQFRDLADVALDHGGSFYLTYHRWATAAQLRAAHPRIDAFLDAKLRHDPDERFRSDWYVALRRTLGIRCRL